MIEGFSMPFRFGRNRSGGGVIICVPDDVEVVFIEMNLRKIKWLIFGTYRPPSQPGECFFKHVDDVLDAYGQTYKKFLLVVILTQEAEPCLSEFLTNYDSKILVKDKNA